MFLTKGDGKQPPPFFLQPVSRLGRFTPNKNFFSLCPLKAIGTVPIS